MRKTSSKNAGTHMINNTIFTEKKEPKKSRYCHINKLDSNQSSFLDSILDRSSSIFSVRSRKNKQVEDVRRKIDQAWDFKAEVIYDAERDTTNQGKTTKGSERKGKDGEIIIDDESSIFNSNNLFESERTSKMEDAPLFDNNNINFQNDNQESSLPSIPKIAVIDSEPKEPGEILEQIVTISEIFQPSEDDLADRILSQSKEPFNINFDIDDGNFMIDFDILPDDNRGQFTAISNFSWVQLNNDIKVNIEKGEILKILSSDGNNNLFGYILDPVQMKEPLLIPLEKTAPIISDFPISSKRTYELVNWNEFGGKEENKMEDLNNQITNQKAATIKYSKDKSKWLLEPSISLDKGKYSKVESIAFLQMDFNTHPMSISLTNDLHQIMPNIKILSGQQGDLICITNKVNKYGWIEGYLMKDLSKKLGMVHTKFIYEL